MLGFFKRRKKEDHLEKVIAYIDRVYTESEESVDRGIKFSVRETQPDDRESHPREEGIKRSCRIQEPYNFEVVSSAREQYFKTGEAKSLIKELEKAKRKTFTEMLMWHITKTGKRILPFIMRHRWIADCFPKLCRTETISLPKIQWWR